MGLSIQVEDEHGTWIGAEVGDPGNLLHRLLPSHGDGGYYCLRFVDWYGDTVFNGIQIPIVRSELARIREQARGDQEHALLGAIDDLAIRAQSDVHLYLRFVGD